MGFTLMGVWLFWMVPGTVFLGIATLWIAQRSETRTLSPRSFFAIGCAAAVGLFLLSLLKYRGWFRWR